MPELRNDDPKHDILREIFGDEAAKEVLADPSHKFSAKLTFEERCAILAAEKSSIPRALIAAAFKIDRRTVGQICNSQSRFYRDVRKHYRDTGDGEFVRRYLTEPIRERLREGRNVLQEKKTAREEYKQVLGGVMVPDARYHSYQGVYILTDIDPQAWDYEAQRAPEVAITFEVVEIEDKKVGVWGYRSLRSSDPTTFWFRNSTDASLFATSNKAYEDAKSVAGTINHD